jgi:hypothetical protein
LVLKLILVIAGFVLTPLVSTGAEESKYSNLMGTCDPETRNAGLSRFRTPSDEVSLALPNVVLVTPISPGELGPPRTRTEPGVGLGPISIQTAERAC